MSDDLGIYKSYKKLKFQQGAVDKIVNMKEEEEVAPSTTPNPDVIRKYLELSDQMNYQPEGDTLNKMK